ncbi:MAG TPA: hypothetical protein VNN73_08225 [Blastocatellia bacterium]|nr:hypothetical protein [Blastocatellia bacterium]
MDINLIPSQTSLLIDANILIYHLGGLSADCTVFLRRVALGEVESYVTTIIIAKTLLRRMIGEAIAKKATTPSQALKKLKSDPKLIATLADYITDIESILKLPIKIIEVTAADIAASHALRKSFGLFVNGSINLVCAQRMGLSHIVTHDDDFDSLPINIWKPMDI